MSDQPSPAARRLHAWLIDHPGATYAEAAAAMGVNVSAIDRLLTALDGEGWLTCEDAGRVWVYYVTRD